MPSTDSAPPAQWLPGGARVVGRQRVLVERWTAVQDRRTARL